MRELLASLPLSGFQVTQNSDRANPLGSVVRTLFAYA